MKKSFSLRAALCCSLAWPLACLPAHAQTAEAAAEEGGEIVVTANRRQENIVDVPLAVTALQGDDLNRKGLTQIESFVSQVPGLSIENQGRIGIRLILRGQNTGGSVGGAAVASMIDEIVLTSGSALSRGALVTANLDLFDMERIEVLRGPQGTLYGANALGGLLKYVAKKPDLDSIGGAAEVGVENVRFGETGYSAKGAINLPIAQDVAAIRVAGYYTDVPGYVDNPLLGLSDVNGGELYGGRAMLLLRPTDALSIRLTAGIQKDSYGGEGITQLVGAPAVSNTETRASFRLVGGRPVENLRFAGDTGGDFQYYNGVVDYDFGGVSLISSTSYIKGDRSFFVDASNGPAAPGLTLAAALGGLFPEPIVALLDQETASRSSTRKSGCRRMATAHSAGSSACSIRTKTSSSTRSSRRARSPTHPATYSSRPSFLAWAGSASAASRPSRIMKRYRASARRRFALASVSKYRWVAAIRTSSSRPSLRPALGSLPEGQARRRPEPGLDRRSVEGAGASIAGAGGDPARAADPRGTRSGSRWLALARVPLRR